MEIDVNTVLCIQDLRTLIRYYFDIKIYIWEHLEIKVGIKIIQYVCIRYITLVHLDDIIHQSCIHVLSFKKVSV